MGCRRRPTLPRPLGRSTIGAVGLNDRVRDGNECGPDALVASEKRNRLGRRMGGGVDSLLKVGAHALTLRRSASRARARKRPDGSCKAVARRLGGGGTSPVSGAYRPGSIEMEPEPIFQKFSALLKQQG